MVDKIYNIGSFKDHRPLNPEDDCIVLRVKSHPNDKILGKAILLQSGEHISQQIKLYPSQLRELKRVLNSLDFEGI